MSTLLVIAVAVAFFAIAVVRPILVARFKGAPTRKPVGSSAAAIGSGIH